MVSAFMAFFFGLIFSCWYPACMMDISEMESDSVQVSTEVVQNSKIIPKDSSKGSTSLKDDLNGKVKIASENKSDESRSMNDVSSNEGSESDSNSNESITASDKSGSTDHTVSHESYSTIKGSDNRNFTPHMHDGVSTLDNKGNAVDESSNDSGVVSSSSNDSRAGSSNRGDRSIHDTKKKMVKPSDPSNSYSDENIPMRCRNCVYAIRTGKGIDECPNCFTGVSETYTDCQICTRIFNHVKQLYFSEDYIDKTVSLIKEYCSKGSVIIFELLCHMYKDDPGAFSYVILNTIKDGYVCGNVGYCPRSNGSMSLLSTGEEIKIECEYCKKAMTAVRRIIENPLMKIAFRDKVSDKCWNIVTRNKIKLCREIGDTIVHYITALMDKSEPEGICVKVNFCQYSRLNALLRTLKQFIRGKRPEFKYIFI